MMTDMYRNCKQKIITVIFILMQLINFLTSVE